MIDASDPAWSAPSPTLDRDYLCAGTPIALDGYRRRVQPQELGWLHAALTAALGRGHGAYDTPTCRVADWALVPWEAAPSGWAVVWWSARDGEQMAATRTRVRLGRVPCELALGALTRIRVPPAYVPGVHALAITARSPVVIKSTNGRSRGAISRGDPHTVHYRTDASSESIEHALAGLARKLGVSSDGVRVARIDARIREVEVAVRGLAQRGSDRGGPSMHRGWIGSVDVLASAPARWLLECASRGLGLGGRVGYGCGRVEVTAAVPRR